MTGALDIKRAAPEMTDVAASANDGGTLHSLARILDAASFGIQIVSSEGRPVYTNPAFSVAQPGTPDDGSDELVFRNRHFSFPLAGETYKVSLSLDETEQCRFERDLVRRAYFDELTGLPNRSL